MAILAGTIPLVKRTVCDFVVAKFSSRMPLRVLFTENTLCQRCYLLESESIYRYPVVLLFKMVYLFIQNTNCKELKPLTCRVKSIHIMHVTW